MKKVKLGDVATYINGYAFKPTDWSKAGVLIIRIQDLTGNSYQANRYNGNYEKKYEIQKGDVLISWSASLGVYVWQGETAVLNQHIFKVVFDKVEIDKNFFVHQVECILKNASSEAHGATMKHLTKPIFDALPFYLPSLEEQKAIAEKLDKVSELIEKRKAQLEKLDLLTKSRFIELFGDPNIEFKYEAHKFKEFVSDMTKGPFGSDMKKDLFVPKGADTYKVYIQANAIQGDQNIGNYYISREYFDSKVFRFEVHPGDYIITCDGTLGKHLKLNMGMERGVISPSLLRLTLNEEKITSEYFEYLWDMYMLLLMKKEARNACLVHLPSAKVIGDIDISIPPFTMQKEFSKFVQKVDKSKFEIQKSLEKLEILKKSLMQQYFG